MKITDLFNSKNARSRNLEGYAKGNIPFVSNSNLNNGIVAYIEADVEDEVIDQVPCIAVNGFGFATVQAGKFIGAGNGGVHIIALLPKEKMSVIELAFYASQINAASWRFSYGRRAILRRLLKVGLKKFDLTKVEIERFKEEFTKDASASFISLFV